MSEQRDITSVYGRRDSDPDPQRNAPSETARRTDGGVEYDLPTERELQLVSVRVETEPNVFKPIGPVKGLKVPIANCLPPSGPYYDEYTLGSHFGEAVFDVHANGEIRVCIVCWGAKHEDTHKKCRKKCRVCKKNDHPGRTCGQIYATVAWWRARGYNVVKTMRVRPSVRELVYLVAAGVVHSFKKLTDPVVLKDNHPLVRELYRTTSMPQYSPGRIVWPKPKRLQEQSRSGVPKQHAGPATEGIEPSNPVSTHSVDPARDPRLMARRVVLEENEEPEGEIASITDQPVTHESGDGVGEASTSVEEFAHQSELIRSLQAENKRLAEALEQARTELNAKDAELIAKDARIAELIGGGGSTGAKRPRT
ncbi:uncharacterized protein J4E87_004633 [Alternaria ethzedia]|uniref:uncharacterized protein n=1 Tax=Alternaria ethzedia TaxID=181014 RepID=UPI0020C3BEC1|nr:uncharacterized protein J4E87_004633 [Alternaria ethzedia]KAI4626133.1 hypothetical protein J4E87_004633 [Alternaria ethzedia]